MAQRGFSLLEVTLAMGLLMAILLVSLRLLLMGVMMTKIQYYQSLAGIRSASLLDASEGRVSEWVAENARVLPEAKSHVANGQLTLTWRYAGQHTITRKL